MCYCAGLEQDDGVIDIANALIDRKCLPNPLIFGKALKVRAFGETPPDPQPHGRLGRCQREASESIFPTILLETARTWAEPWALLIVFRTLRL